jgi:SAM-dependent methyltransferase
MSSTANPAVAGLAFDRLASAYDSLFTFSAIGRAQRDAVWEYALRVFAKGSHILELNCGTGEDALFLESEGMSVTACDASMGMIEEARQKADGISNARIEFLVLRTEEIDSLPETPRIDGVFSNFSGLNCVGDLRSVAQALSKRLPQRAPLLLCFSTRYCLCEVIYFLLHGEPKKAMRRWKGSSQAHFDTLEFPVFYPRLAQIRRAFAPEFRLVSTIGIGIAVPPSYVESWISRRPRLLKLMDAIDDLIRTWPVMRTFGDHMLIHLERVQPCQM